MMPTAWVICGSQAMNVAAASVVDSALGLAPNSGRTTTTYCAPLKHPERDEWAYPIDSVTTPLKSALSAQIGVSLDWITAGLPTLLDGSVSSLTQVVIGVGTVTVVRSLDASWRGLPD